MTVWNLVGFVIGIGLYHLMQIAYIEIKMGIQRRKWRKQ